MPIRMLLRLIATLLLAACGGLQPAQPAGAPGQVLGDLHMHTTCSDGDKPYEDMVQAALARGYGFIAITDHHFDGRGEPCGTAAGRCDEALCLDVIRQCRQETRLLCIPGHEITGKSHVLALNITQGIDASLPVAAQVAEIHRQGGYAIAAHPAGDPVYSASDLLNSGFDAMECRGRPSTIPGSGDWASVSRQYGIPCVYGSDAHAPGELGQAITACQGPITSLADLAAAIRAGRCRRGD